MASTVGYSAKTLTQKLGIKPGDVVLAINPPSRYAALLDPLPEGVRVVAAADAPRLIHAFFETTEALLSSVEALSTKPAVGGAIWISWPKKTSPKFVDLTENRIRDAVLPTGWVDVKVCAVDDDWSGLKFLRRRA